MTSNSPTPTSNLPRSDRNNFDWMISTHDELEDDYWGYPQSNHDVDLTDTFKLGGPWPVYPAMACTFEPHAYEEFHPFMTPWLPGTTLDEVISSGFPLDTLFDAPPANGWGYTHGESTLPVIMGIIADCFLTHWFLLSFGCISPLSCQSSKNSLHI